MLCEVGSVSPFSTIMFSAKAAGRTMSPDSGSIRKCSLETIRPSDEALVSSRGWPLGSWTTQLYGWWVWPLTTASIAGLRFCAISRPGPLTPVQSLYAVASEGATPSCSSTTIDLMPRSLSFGTSALAVSTSSAKSMFLIPDGLTMVSVASSVMPMKATFSPLTSITFTPGKAVARWCSSGRFHITLAPR